MKIDIVMTGIDTVSASFASLTSSAADQKRMKAMYTQAQRTLRKAISYTPVATGALRGSGEVIMQGQDIIIKFGGPAAGYAPYVHEILSNAHPIGQAKFLERAVAEDAAAIIAAATA